MADEEDNRLFVPDPTPAGMDPEIAEWILRQLYRITGTSSEVVIRQEEGNNTLNEHIANQNNPHQTTHVLLPDITGPTYNPHGMMRWRKDWVGNTNFFLYDTVLRNGWLAIANKTTTDDPEPTPAGNRQWLTGKGDSPTWANSSVAVTTNLLVGLRFATPVDEAFFRYAVRVWVPIGTQGQSLAVWVVDDPLGEEGEPQFINILPSFVIQPSNEGEWVTIGLGRDFLPLGRTFDIVAAFASENAQGTWADDWDAKRKDDTDVSSGEVWHGSSQGQGSRFSYTAEGQNREADLKGLSAGDEIVLQGSTYLISDTEADDANDAMVVWTQPHCRPQENTYTYAFNTLLPASITYVDDGLAWVTRPEVQGLFSTTGYNELTASQRMYGVDIEFEGANASPDWDIQAYSG